MPPVIPVEEAPPEEPGCFSKRSGLEKCLIILVIIIVVIAIAMIIMFLIYYFFFSPPEGTCLTDGCVKSASRIKEHMNPDLDPCNSFYDYACNSWSKKQVLARDQEKLDMETQLEKDHHIKLRALLSAGVDSEEAEFYQKPKLYYSSCMNVAKLDELGAQPFLDVVESVGKFPALDPNWNSSHVNDYNFQDMVMKLARMSVMPLFTVQVEPYSVDPSKNRLYLSDGSLALGQKKHYVDDLDTKMLSGYQQWMVNTLVLLGADVDSAEEDVEKVIEFEVRLAKLRRDDSDKESFKSSYKTLNVGDIQRNYKWMKWAELMQGITSRPGAGIGVYIGEDEPIVNKEPKYFDSLGSLINSTSKRVVANYLMSHLLPLTGNLGSDFIEEIVNYGENVKGEKMPQRWKYCATLTASVYEEAVSRMFVEKYFPKEAKEKVEEIVDDVVTVFRDQLVNNKWMTGETSGHALEKLKHLKVKVGYPEFLYDDEGLTKLYKDVSAGKDSFMTNSVSLMEFKAAENMKKLRKSNDKKAWNASPTAIDTRYDVKTNELVLPAGFLQTPIFNPEFSNAMNYAGVASVVGREIIHGFDTLGKHYNAEGIKEKWWTPRDEEGFKSRSSCFSKQWGCYKWDGISMSGEKTLGENIAYNAGLKHGYKAYEAMIRRRGTEEKRLPGLKMDNHQVFFISYAQMWCAKYGDQAKRNFLATCDHPPFPYRVYGTLQNSDEFSDSFDCPIGTRMNPREKCNMW